MRTSPMLAALSSLLALVGCDFFDKGDPPPIVSGRGVGEACENVG